MKILRYLKPYWFLAFLSPLCMIVEVLMDLILPKLMSQIVDQGVLGGNLDLIIQTGGKMILLAVVGVLGGVASGFFASTASQKFGNDLRQALFSKAMYLSFQQTDQFTTGSLVTRLTNDTNAVVEFVATALRMFVRMLMFFFGGIAMALSLNAHFGKVLLISLPLQLIVLLAFISKASPLFGKVQKRLDRVNSVVQENVTGARVVKAYAKEEHEIKRFGAANEDLMQMTFRVQKLLAMMMPTLMVLLNMSVIAIIFLGGWQVEARAMQVGDVMAAVTYTQQIMMSVMMVGMMLHQITRARASMERLNEVLDTKPALVDGVQKPANQQGSVSFEGVSFQYPSSKQNVLTNLNFHVQPGERFAILGATGSGKTSLVHLIPRFYEATEGKVLVDGQDVLDLPLKDLRDKMAIVLQKSELYSGSICDNIRWGKEQASMEEVVRAATIAQADEFISSFAEGYDTPVSEKGASLSGGQKQRIAIARAIVKKPQILILDDSTSALDLSTEARLQQALREELSDTTVIMIAQRVQSVKQADRILVLDNGAMADCGSHEELLQRCGVYQDIYHSQVREGETI